MTPIRIVCVERLELRFAPRPWPFADARRAEIESHFAARKRDKPALWNGRVLLLHDWTLADEVFRGVLFETDFASFLAWREWNFPDAAAFNCFAAGALRSADGAFLLGVMAAHTASAGQIYFPAGTPEPGDVTGANVDFYGSLMRELSEETGLLPGDVTARPGWHLVFAGARIAILKVLQSPESAADLRAKILVHLARQPNSELADIRIVNGRADFDPRMPAFITAFLTAMCP